MTIENTVQKLKELVAIYPKLIGNEAVNFFKSNFDKEGWQGETFEKWPSRKRETRLSTGKPILFSSGTLKRSIQVKSTSESEVVVGTAGQIPYARIHNEGGQITQAARSETFVRNRFKKAPKRGQFRRGVKPGKGFTFRDRTINIPKRQFMGDSPVLRARLKEMAINEIKKAIQ